MHQIKCYSINEACNVAYHLINRIKKSRFAAEIVTQNKKVLLKTIRLKESKSYCGNHAGPCRLNGIEKHRKLKFLEGCDWISFNDLVNDTLDHLNFSGFVGSSVCIVRKGGERRLSYFGIDGGEFDKDTTDYMDYRGLNSPRSLVQAGTPGILGE